MIRRNRLLVVIALCVAASGAFFQYRKPRASFEAPTNALGFNECVKYLSADPAAYCEASATCVEAGTKSLLIDLETTQNVSEKIKILSRLGALNSYQSKSLSAAEGFYEQAIALLNKGGSEMKTIQTMQISLAALQLRYGELENCVHHHNAESCLFPLSKNAEHRLTKGSQKALQTLSQILEANPGQIMAKWLYNVAAMTLGRYPEAVPKALLISPELFKGNEPFPKFSDIGDVIGLNENQFQGRGALIEDLNGDGYLDILMSGRDFCDPLIYLESQKNGHFVNKSVPTHLAQQLRVFNIIQGDYDNDGHTDLYLMRGAWDGRDSKLKVYNSLMRNNGDGTFEDVTEFSGLKTEPNMTNSAVWYDFDRDGFLDLFVCNENRGPDLFKNLGNGHFLNVIAGSGIANNHICKGVAVADVDGDGLPDIFLSNFAAEKRLFLNKGDFKFEEQIAPETPSAPFKSFTTWFMDFNNDGFPDLFVASYNTNPRAMVKSLDTPQGPEFHPHLYINDGHGKLIDSPVTNQMLGSSMVMGANFGDINNDGFPDLFLGTGGPEFFQLIPDRVFLNIAGKELRDITFQGNFGNLQKGHAVAFGDLDNDGYPEILSMHGGMMPSDSFVQSLYAGPGQKVFKNHWLSLQLQGVQSNRSAIGARIRVTTKMDDATEAHFFHTIDSGGSFGSNPLRATIGLGKARAITEVEIRWPHPHSIQKLTGFKMDRFYHVLEGQEKATQLELKTFKMIAE